MALKMRQSLAQLEREFPTAADLRRVTRVEDVRHKARLLARLFSNRVQGGKAIGRIVIPSIHLDMVAVQGTDTASLQKGPGHYPSSPFPGQAGTTAFAGHRTTYLAPFRHLDSLEPGDEVVFLSPPWFFYEMLILAAGGERAERDRGPVITRAALCAPRHSSHRSFSLSVGGLPRCSFPYPLRLPLRLLPLRPGYPCLLSDGS